MNKPGSIIKPPTMVPKSFCGINSRKVSINMSKSLQNQSLVPKSFNLAGLTITVVLDSELFKQTGRIGWAKYPEQQIVLDSSTCHINSIEHNFFHELVHWIFYVLNKTDLRNDETLVDTFALMLHHGLKSGSNCYLLEDLGCKP